MSNQKKAFLFCSVLVSLSMHISAQQFTGFKNIETQKKLEASFDSKLSAKRVGENIKLMSSVPHHIG